MFLFIAPDEEKKIWRGSIYFVKSVHKSLIYIRRNFGGDRMKIEAARKQKPQQQQKCFFQALNRKNRPKTGNLFLSKKTF